MSFRRYLSQRVRVPARRPLSNHVKPGGEPDRILSGGTVCVPFGNSRLPWRRQLSRRGRASDEADRRDCRRHGESVTSWRSGEREATEQRSGDLHMLIDIGAGTVDVVTFNVGYLNDEDRFPIFEAEVARFGTHYLLASRAATIQRYDQAWRESDAGLSTTKFADLYGNPDQKLTSLSEQFGQELTKVLVSALGKTKARRYPLSPALKTSVPVFIGGGGKGIDVNRQAFALAGNRFALRKLRLPLADNIQSANLNESNFDRVSVAHGLSFFADDLGKICRRSEVEDVPAYWNRPTSLEDRFVGKDQV